VTCAIPGAKTPAQARDNFGAADLPPIDDATLSAVTRIYDDLVRPHVHGRW